MPVTPILITNASNKPYFNASPPKLFYDSVYDLQPVKKKNNFDALGQFFGKAVQKGKLNQLGESPLTTFFPNAVQSSYDSNNVTAKMRESK